MDRNKVKNKRRQNRHWRVRRRVQGRAARPRLAIYRSLKHIYAQLVNDESDTGSVTIAAASTRDKDMKDKYGGNVDAAKAVGAAIAVRAKELGIKQVSFDRGGFRYHGRVKALADSARENGLEF